MGDTSLTDAEFTYSSPNMCVSDSLLSSGTYSTQSLWPFRVIIYSYRNETVGWGFLVGSERQAVLVGFTECDTHIVELSYLGKSSVAPVSGVPWRQCFGGSVATTQAILKDMSNTRSRADCLYMGDCEESDTLKVLYSLLKTWSRNRKFLWHWRIFYLLQLQDWHNKFVPDSTSSGFFYESWGISWKTGTPKLKCNYWEEFRWLIVLRPPTLPETPLPTEMFASSLWVEALLVLLEDTEVAFPEMVAYRLMPVLLSWTAWPNLGNLSKKGLITGYYLTYGFEGLGNPTWMQFLHWGCSDRDPISTSYPAKPLQTQGVGSRTSATAPSAKPVLVPAAWSCVQPPPRLRLPPGRTWCLVSPSCKGAPGGSIFFF